MKKTYEAPSVEKIAFKYRDQVVVASGIPSGNCSYDWTGDHDSQNVGCHTYNHQGSSTL